MYACFISRCVICLTESSICSTGSQQYQSPQSVNGSLPHGSSLTPNNVSAPTATSTSRDHGSGKRSLEEWASNYSIPWSRANAAFRSALAANQRPKKTDLLHFVRKVGEDWLTLTVCN